MLGVGILSMSAGDIRSHRPRELKKTQDEMRREGRQRGIAYPVRLYRPWGKHICLIKSSRCRLIREEKRRSAWMVRSFPIPACRESRVLPRLKLGYHRHAEDRGRVIGGGKCHAVSFFFLGFVPCQSSLNIFNCVQLFSSRNLLGIQFSDLDAILWSETAPL